MNFKAKITTALLAGAMLALPFTTPVFAAPANSVNSNYVEQVNWWHSDRKRKSKKERVGK